VTNTTMHSIAIRQIDDALKRRLRREAAREGCSMEEHARRILRAGLAPTTDKAPTALVQEHLAHRIRARFVAAGTVDMPDVARHLPRPPGKL